MIAAGKDKRATGRHAQSLKYDRLSAIGVWGCAGDKARQKLALRLITLIVARYNWAQDELCVGQAEIARLWGLDERSVKRELAKLRALDWLVVKRPAARGRVAVHGLAVARILAATRPDWDRIGPDFEARLDRPDAPEPNNVISFPAPDPGNGSGGVWAQVQAQLFRDDPHLYSAWFAGLRPVSDSGDCLVLAAPSRFHATYIQTNHADRLLRLARHLDPQIARVVIDSAAGG